MAMNYLFNEHDMFSWLDAHQKQISSMVQAIQSNTLLSRPTDDVVAEIVDRLRMEVPVIRRDEAHADQQEAQVRSRDFADDYGLPGRHPLVMGTVITLPFPIRVIVTSSGYDPRPTTVCHPVQPTMATS